MPEGHNKLIQIFPDDYVFLSGVDIKEGTKQTIHCSVLWMLYRTANAREKSIDWWDTARKRNYCNLIKLQTDTSKTKKAKSETSPTKKKATTKKAKPSKKK